MGAHIIRRGEALSRGATDHELQRQCRTGTWQRLRPGTYASRAELDELNAVEVHRLLAEATVRAASPDAVLSHQSAAVVHDLHLWNTPLAAAHLTRNRPNGGRRTRHRHVHSAILPPNETTEVGGVRVTTLARTVLDLSRSLPFEQAVVAGDHALQAKGLTSTELAATADSLPTHARRSRALRVVTQLDGRSESVGESRSRVLMVREQLPIPDCQAVLYAADGTRLGRVDFLFEEFGTIGEFDGKVKYGRLVPDGDTPADVVWAEKQREDAIRDAGWQVARWTWDELETPHVIVDRITEKFELARKCPPPRGRIVHTPRP
ncbi:hypothetical protein ERC79_08280 [Rhodococcus sp. ABRD24]|uniref:hypothetical protein n=1 Tax=Rhodococcus sp. ABRD24 TaxID=2507582 RepID=UPI00103B1EDA|nr:hypothetical protein [Rhodococcus sp. ABRD24]QBJ95969.1 hypothetical protein ERC79_08280 [Rhodococcus sp. ABRD24]